MIDSPNEPLWDTLETAAFLGISHRQLRKLRNSADRDASPPAYRIGQVYRYVPSEVRAWVKARRVEPSESVIECSA
jgi:hypothetical protein